MSIRRILTRATVVLFTVVMVATCGDDDPAGPPVVTSYVQSFGWDCATGTNCQDVFDFEFQGGSSINITADEVSSGSVLQLALYGPGVALGGTNLLTGTTNELRCNLTEDCAAHTAGQTLTNVAVGQSGRYRLAITRHWDHSCGSSGTYRLSVTSATPFQVHGQTVEDQPSLAPGLECK